MSNSLSLEKTKLFVLLALIFFGAALSFTFLPLLLIPLREDLSISNSLAGLLYTVLLVGSGLARFLGGGLASRFGKIALIRSACLLMALGAGFLALAPSYGLALPAALLLGIGNGLYVPNSFSLVSDLFPEKRGRMIGLYDSIFPFSALGAFGMERLSSFTGDWRYGMGSLALYMIVLLTALLFYRLWGRPALLPEQIFSGRREDASFSIRGEAKRVLDAVKNSPSFLRIFLLVIPVGVFSFGFLHSLPSFLVEARGLSQAGAGLVYFIYMGLNIPGKNLAGHLIESRGAKVPLLLSFGLAIAGTLLVVSLPQLLPLFLGLFLIAPARGGIFTIMHTHLLGNLPEDTVDLLYGFFMVMVTITGAIGPALMGLIIDYGGFIPGLLFLAGVLISGLPLTLRIGKS